MQFTLVDVFAEGRYEGNQLAVVTDAGALAADAMQAIAREFDFSETTFVTATAPGRARVRIFTPAEELPFAGHPVLGTAWVLARGAEQFVLELEAGEIHVRFADDLAWLTPPAAEFGELLDRTQAAHIIGLTPAALDPAVEPRLIRCGPWFVIIVVRDLTSLQQIRVDDGRLAQAGLPSCVFVASRGGYHADAAFGARMLFHDGRTLREDPATGSANAAFAQYLQRLGTRGRPVVEQGFEIGRPSRIHLLLQDSGPGVPVRVGGRVRAVAEGRLL